MRIRSGLLVMTLLSSLMLSGCYVVQQGVGQLQLLSRREPVAKVLADPLMKADAKAKLVLIARAKRYAQDVIGLRRTSNYEDYVQLDRDAVSYVVSAAPADKLEPYTWWFPIIGNVPYKGYFDRNEAVKLQDSLKAEGYDTILRGVPAFSTLGWLSDPVYSPFLGYDVPVLANVIIHETTHATLFLPGQASFNEGFATFVGNEGAVGFLTEAFGPNSPEVAAAKAEIADNAIFTEFVQSISKDLEALYNGPTSRDAKIRDREAIFTAARERFTNDYIPRLRGHQFRHFPQSNFNNAALISYRTYYNRLDRFVGAHAKLGGSLKDTVRFFKEVVAKQSEPEHFLDDYLAFGLPSEIHWK
jgi:predicted aminopeptidase